MSWSRPEKEPDVKGDKHSVYPPFFGIIIYMEKIFKALTSRTFVVAVLLFLVSGFHGVQDLIPASFVMPVEAILTFLIGYFKVNPSQQY